MTPGFYYCAVLVATLVTPWVFSQSKAYLQPKGPLEEHWVASAAVSLLKLTIVLGLLFVVLEPNTAASRGRYGLWVACLWSAVLTSRWSVKRILWGGRRSRGVGTTIAIVGANAAAGRLMNRIDAGPETHYPFELMGVFDDRTAVRDTLQSAGADGSIEDLISRSRASRLDQIIIALPSGAQTRQAEIVNRLKPLGVEVTMFLDEPDLATPGLQPSTLDQMPLVFLTSPPLTPWDQACKRALDWSISLTVLIFLAPLLVIICIATRLDSPGPVLFRQKRNGLNGREFVIYKFRSMFVEAADHLGARQTELNDARVTRVGRILRASSLDELPQLFNVLEGTMSLVGPRPHPVGMRTEALLCEEISPQYAHRHQVKPGITGWAQVHGCRGATTTIDDLLTRIAFDLDYIDHWSLLLDLKILVLTPALLFLGERPKTMASSAPNRMAAIALVCLVSLLGPRSGSAETYYVSAIAGQDTAIGSPDHPWRTLRRSVQALKPGDKLIVRAGRYLEPLVAEVSGTAQHPIAVIGEGRPLVEATEDAVSLRGSYILFQGFEAHSVGWGSAIAVGKNNHHVRIVDNVARDSACGGISAVQTDYLTIQGNRVFGNARRAPWQCSGISIYEAVAEDAAPGIHNIIRNNIVYDNMNIFVDNTVSHSNGKTTDGNGIIIDDNDHSQNQGVGAPYIGATLIKDNTIFDNGGRGIHVYRSSNVVVINNVSFHNLKDYNLQRPAAELSAAFSRGVKMFDNIAVASPGGAGMMDAYSEGSDFWDYNLVNAGTPFVGVQSNVRWGVHNITGRDPKFVRGEIRPTADFHLAVTSPGIGAGAVIRLGGPDLASAAPASRMDVGLTAH